ncbi:MAG: hypothetical protein LBH00_06865, partial [Planctomycetaceae bacterium]|nr:hypothetical protein [Planctomycetaceae bacterium]
NAFAQFLNGLLDVSVAAVDGKSAKQMKGKNGNPILMLNVFAQKAKTCLAGWSVNGDKTNEPTCLKKYLEQLPLIFSGVKQREPDNKLVCKKRGE